MRIALTLQAFLLYGLLTFGAGVWADDSASTADPTASQGSVEDWILGLGSPDWKQREEATRQLLAAGGDAVPALRAGLAAADPEIRRRLTWLLEILAPTMHRVRAVRLGEGIPGDRSSRQVQEWVEFTLEGRDPRSGLTTNREGAGTRFWSRVADQDGGVRIWARLGDDDGEVRTSYLLQPGEMVLLRVEDRVQQDQFRGRIDRVVLPSMWLLSLDVGNEIDPSQDRDTLAQTIASELQATLRQGISSPDETRRRDALQVAGFWGNQELVVAGTPEPAAEGWLARLEAGDDRALEPLEHWLSEQIAVEKQGAPTTENQTKTAAELLLDRVTFALVARGIDIALNKFLHEVSELGPWEQYVGVLALNRFIETGSATPEQFAAIASATLDANVFPHLPWTSIETQILVQHLVDHGGEQVLGKAVELLEAGLGRESRTAYYSTRALVRAVIQLQSRFEVATDAWFEPMALPLIESQGYAEEGFCLIRDALIRSQLSAEQWDQTMEAVIRVFQSDNRGAQNRLENLLKIFVHYPGLTPKQARTLWRARLSCYDVPDSYLKTRVDPDLVAKFGELDEPMPRLLKDGSNEPWEERRKAWLARIEAASDELLSGPAPDDEESNKTYRLLEAVFRIDDAADQARLLEFKSSDYQGGVAYPAMGPDGNDESRTIRPLRRGQPRNRTQYLVTTGRYLFLGKPLLTSTGNRSMYLEQYMRKEHYGPENSARRPVQYQTLYLLDEAERLEDIGTWDEMAAHLVELAFEAQGRDRQQFFDTIGKLRLRENLPAMRERFDEEPETNLARALLLLGDSRGIELLRKSVDERPSYEAVQTLARLVNAGDIWAIDRSLEWIESPPPSVKNQGYSLIDALERLLQTPKGSLIDETRLLRALISALDQRNLRGKVIPLLRLRTGLDMGYFTTFRMTDRAKQQSAQNDVVERWRAWWRETAPEGKPNGR